MEDAQVLKPAGDIGKRSGRPEDLGAGIRHQWIEVLVANRKATVLGRSLC